MTALRMDVMQAVKSTGGEYQKAGYDAGKTGQCCGLRQMDALKADSFESEAPPSLESGFRRSLPE